MLFTLGADCPSTTDLDEGFHVTPAGLELRPAALPATVSASTDALPFAQVAVAWWNEALGCEVLELVDGAADVFMTTGLVPASTEDVDSGGEPLGLAEVDYAEDGTVLGGTITIAYEITYDAETSEQVARHELGHLPLALADDPGPPTTVDLRSVMASPLDPLGVLTDGDRARLEPFLAWCP
jgi:hypothetical protein